MRRPLLASVLLTAFCCSAACAAEPTLPTGGAPQFLPIAKVNKEQGLLTVRLVNMVPVTVEKTVTEEVNGQVIARKVAVTEYSLVHVESNLALNQFRVLDIDGKEIERDLVWKRLTAGKIVLRLPGKEPLDPAYRKLFAKDVLILAPK